MENGTNEEQRIALLEHRRKKYALIIKSERDPVFATTMFAIRPQQQHIGVGTQTHNGTGGVHYTPHHPEHDHSRESTQIIHDDDRLIEGSTTSRPLAANGHGGRTKDPEFRVVFERLSVRRKAYMERVTGSQQSRLILPDHPKKIYLPSVAHITPRREILTGGQRSFPTLRAKTSHTPSPPPEHTPLQLGRAVPLAGHLSVNGIGGGATDTDHNTTKEHPNSSTLAEYFQRRRSAPVLTRIATKYFVNESHEVTPRDSQPAESSSQVEKLNSSLQLTNIRNLSLKRSGRHN